MVAEMRHVVADRVRLATEKAKSNFAHPLGVKPKHRKIVRTFGQVHLVLILHAFFQLHALVSGSRQHSDWCGLTACFTISLYIMVGQFFALMCHTHMHTRHCVRYSGV